MSRYICGMKTDLPTAERTANSIRPGTEKAFVFMPDLDDSNKDLKVLKDENGDNLEIDVYNLTFVKIPALATAGQIADDDVVFFAVMAGGLIYYERPVAEQIIYGKLDAALNSGSTANFTPDSNGRQFTLNDYSTDPFIPSGENIASGSRMGVGYNATDGKYYPLISENCPS